MKGNLYRLHNCVKTVSSIFRAQHPFCFLQPLTLTVTNSFFLCCDLDASRMVLVINLTLFHPETHTHKNRRWPNTTENCGIIFVWAPNKISTQICHLSHTMNGFLKRGAISQNDYSSYFILWHLPPNPKRGRYEKNNI